MTPCSTRSGWAALLSTILDWVSIKTYIVHERTHQASIPGVHWVVGYCVVAYGEECGWEVRVKYFSHGIGTSRGYLEYPRPWLQLRAFTERLVYAPSGCLDYFLLHISPLLYHHMTRPLPADKKKTVGRKPTFTVKKAAQLAKFATLFQDAQDTGTQSSFYHKLTLWCVTRWGHNVKDLSRDDPDEVEDDGDATLEVDEMAALGADDLTEEEADQNAIYFNILRTVSVYRIIIGDANSPIYSETGTILPPAISTHTSVSNQWFSRPEYREPLHTCSGQKGSPSSCSYQRVYVVILSLAHERRSRAAHQDR